MTVIDTIPNRLYTAGKDSTADKVNHPAQIDMRTLQLGMSWFAERPGGLERFYCELLQHLPEVGVGRRGLVVGTKNVETASHGMVSAVADEKSKLLARWSAMRKAVSTELGTQQYDLVVSHHALYTAPVVSLLSGLPLVVHFQGPYADESWAEKASWPSYLMKRWMEKRVYSQAARCITLSRAFAKILHSSYGVPQEKIRVIPGSVETERFNPVENRQQARTRLGWPTDRPIVLSVRRLARRMGLENLIAAAKIIRQHVPDVLVLIAGKGSLADELQSQIKSGGLEDHVRLLGFVPDADLPLAYRAADLTVVPTVSLEGFGLITVESLAAGTPPIVTDIGASPEVVTGLSPNLIIPNASDPVNALATTLTSAIKRRTRPAQRGGMPNLRRNNYDWSATISRVKDVYREALHA